MDREESIRRLAALYRRMSPRMTPDQRRVAASLLRDARAGRLTRHEAMRRSARVLGRAGLTPNQAWRKLRLTPYYRHVKRLLND